MPQERSQPQEEDVDAGKIASLICADVKLLCKERNTGDDDRGGKARHHSIDGALEEEKVLASRRPILVIKKVRIGISKLDEARDTYQWMIRGDIVGLREPCALYVFGLIVV
jgi:hypothetical protein